MTRNLFLGADLRPVYAALSERLADVPDAVAGVLGMVQLTDFPARARAIAGEIEAARPDLIGLQEAAVWRSSSYEADNLELLEAELVNRGLRYRRVATVANGDVELGGVALTDRDAILARVDLDITDAAAGTFSNALRVSTARGEFPLKRGWASVDGGGIRFITTHLESASARAVQTLQMGELLAGPANTPLPVVIAGDFNAHAGTPAYSSPAPAALRTPGRPAPPAATRRRSTTPAASSARASTSSSRAASTSRRPPRSALSPPAAGRPITTASSRRSGRVRERRRALPADDRGRLVNQIVVLERLDHEEGEVHAARDVALEDRVADVAAPHGQALAVALLEVAAAHHRPAGVAGEDAPARLDLVVEVGEAGEPCEAAADLTSALSRHE